MIVPSKFTPFDKTVLAKIGYLLIDVDEISLKDLYKQKINRFSDISEFIITIDVLYTLGKIELNMKTGMVIYADRN